MGGICTNAYEDDKHSALVDSEITKDKKRDMKIKKLLLLGSGGSGKSTFFKQLQTIHGSGFTDNDRLSYQNHVYHQIIEQMKTLIRRAREFVEEEPDLFSDCVISDDAYDAAEFFCNNVRDDALVDEMIGDQVEMLWSDPGIQNTYKHRARICVTESSKYFFDNIRRIAARNYIPNQRDIILCRHRTTGVVDKLFTIRETQMRIVDVGGQRAERKKWFSCFEDVTAVIYCASLSGYDESMYEDEMANVMHDSLDVFEDRVIKNQWFIETSVILFLNKVDIFNDKIEHIPITVCFDDFPEEANSNSRDEALQFITHKYHARNNTDKQIYTHVTCATDPHNVERVFNDVQHIAIEKSLDAGGLL